ncbi:MAG TPA: hypothetical protein VFE25_09235 [Opitutaceae bacterium]|jgi:hypothetical protein|nr:hypothetical protein [Opitutaceae bacterium]
MNGLSFMVGRRRHEFGKHTKLTGRPTPLRSDNEPALTAAPSAAKLARMPTEPGRLGPNGSRLRKD